MPSAFSLDDKQLLYSDAFGVTRLDLSKPAAKVTKHTWKVTNAASPLCLSADGKRAFAYRGAPRPPAPACLPGALAANDQRALFIPWHAESIVDLDRDAAHPRGLEPAPGAFRRLLLEVMARDNAALRPLNLQATLTAFDHSPKGARSPFGRRLPSLPPTLPFVLATEHTGDLTQRFHLHANGWSWGSASGEGGVSDRLRAVSLDDVRDALRWLRRADILPLEVAPGLIKLSQTLGGGAALNAPPSDAFPPDAQRLLLRALLATTRAEGWPLADGPHDDLPAAWAQAPISDADTAAALDALAALRRWRRPVPDGAAEALPTTLLTSLRDAALRPLLALLSDPAPFSRDQYRHAAYSLISLCHQRPTLRPQAVAALREITHAHPEWLHIQAPTCAAVESGHPALYHTP